MMEKIPKKLQAEDLQIHEVHGEYFAIKDLKITDTEYDGAFVKFTISYLATGNKELAEDYVKSSYETLAKEMTGQWMGNKKDA